MKQTGYSGDASYDTTTKSSPFSLRLYEPQQVTRKKGKLHLDHASEDSTLLGLHRTSEALGCSSTHANATMCVMVGRKLVSRKHHSSLWSKASLYEYAWLKWGRRELQSHLTSVGPQSRTPRNAGNHLGLRALTQRTDELFLERKAGLSTLHCRSLVLSRKDASAGRGYVVRPALTSNLRTFAHRSDCGV